MLRWQIRWSWEASAAGEALPLRSLEKWPSCFRSSLNMLTCSKEGTHIVVVSGDVNWPVPDSNISSTDCVLLYRHAILPLLLLEGSSLSADSAASVFPPSLLHLTWNHNLRLILTSPSLASHYPAELLHSIAGKQHSTISVTRGIFYKMIQKELKASHTVLFISGIEDISTKIISPTRSPFKPTLTKNACRYWISIARYGYDSWRRNRGEEISSVAGVLQTEVFKAPFSLLCPFTLLRMHWVIRFSISTTLAHKIVCRLCHTVFHLSCSWESEQGLFDLQWIGYDIWNTGVIA